MATGTAGALVAANARRGRLTEIWDSRQLLVNLTGRELKVRYKRSVVGFLWSLLNPLLMMAVFTIVFTQAFRIADIEDFPIFFLVAYLPWTFFQTTVQVSTGIVVGNANLVKKIYFPREVLPLSVVSSQAVHFGLAMLVLFGALIVTGYDFWLFLPGFLLATVILVAFATGLSLLFAALNTQFRDIQEFSGVLFLLWFYVTPIVYPRTVLSPTLDRLISLNPMTHVVSLFRASLYELETPDWGNVAVAAASAAAMLVFGHLVYGRMSARFAKEL